MFNYLYSFNSIKVRLRLRPAKESNLVREFQFHKGTIKTVLVAAEQLPVFGFNSIKVRLRQRSSPAAARATSFQFHKGTIKTLRQP